MGKTSVAVAFMDHGDDGGWVGNDGDDYPKDVPCTVLRGETVGQERIRPDAMAIVFVTAGMGRC